MRVYIQVPVEINGKEEFIIGSPNISNEQAQEYLKLMNNYKSMAEEVILKELIYTENV